MALPSPVALLRKIINGIGWILLGILFLFALFPFVHWGLIILGIVLLLFKHWWIGIALIALGIITKNIRL